MSEFGNEFGNESGTSGGAVAPADWLERMLAENARDHADGYILDDGFTARVMNMLPAPALPPAWRKPALAALWGVAAVGLAVALPGAAVDVAREAFKLFAAKPFTLYEVGAVLAVAGVGMWATVFIVTAQSFASARYARLARYFGPAS